MNVIPDLKGPFVYPYPSDLYFLHNFNIYDGRSYIDPHFLNNPTPIIPTLVQPVSVPSSQKTEDKKQELVSESPAKPAAQNTQLPGTEVKNNTSKSTNQLMSEVKVPPEQANAVFAGWNVPILVNNGNMEEKQFPPNCHLVQVGPNLFSAVYMEPRTLPSDSDSNETKSISRYSKNQKPTRHRRNFNQEIKRKILDLYHSYLTKENRLSVRSIAHHIFCRLSREIDGFDYSFKNIITLLYNYRQKQ